MELADLLYGQTGDRFVAAGKQRPQRVEVGDLQHVEAMGRQPAKAEAATGFRLQSRPKLKEHFDKRRSEETRVRQVENDQRGVRLVRNFEQGLSQPAVED